MIFEKGLELFGKRSQVMQNISRYGFKLLEWT